MNQALQKSAGSGVDVLYSELYELKSAYREVCMRNVFTLGVGVVVVTCMRVTFSINGKLCLVMTHLV